MEYWVLFTVQSFLLLLVCFYFYIQNKYTFWSNLGVKGPTPSFFDLGNVFQIARKPPPEIEVELMQQYGLVYGTYHGLKPTLTVIDNELIRQILVKDFPSWINRRQLNAYHDVNSNHQFNADDKSWKRLRTITGKAFTSARLRSVRPIMEQCVDRFVGYLAGLANNKESALLDTKAIVAGFTIDVIASTAFGVELQSSSATAEANPFAVNAQALFDANAIVQLSYLAMPRWFNDLVGIHLNVALKPFKFFIDLLTEILRQRRESGAKRSDLVQLLLDSYASDAEIDADDNFEQLTATVDSSETSEADVPSSHSKSKLSERDIIAQCYLFLIAGFETTGSTLSNIIYELTVNADVQDRLRGEIKAQLGSLCVSSEAYYDAIMTQMPYMDAVIKETLRRYPPLVRLDRRLTADYYKLAGIRLQKDQLVEIPTIAVHYNPRYYPEPEKFKPDRFLPENRHLLVPFTFLPFGAGPRNCIGMRFAYQEIKLCLCKMLTTVRLTPCASTPPKPVFEPFKPLLYVKPFQVKVELL